MPDSERHLQASEIFREAIELPESERESFIIAACRGDPDLLHEVQSLIEYDAGEADTAPTPLPPDALVMPSTFGRYQVLEKIGRGGMGEVWKAWDPKLARNVALKFLPIDLAHNQSVRERFLREGRNASTLKHDGIATVFDAGEIEGRDYIAFEFIDGESVTHHVKAGPLPPAEAVKIATLACDALAYAHARDVIHRDMTSNNIMVTNDGNVVVVDFGLAIAQGAEKVTRSGATMGTLAYMAPEAFGGAEPDTRVDVYGLGVVLYEMLTGKLPFDSELPYALPYMILNKDPRPPSERDARLPKELDAVVMRAMARDRDNRFQTALQFMAALEPMLRAGILPEVPEDQRIIRKRIPSPGPGPVVRWRWRIALGLAVLAVALGLGRLVPGPGPFKNPRVSSVAVLPIEVVGPDTDIPPWMTSGLGRGLVIRLSKLPRVRVVTWASSQQFTPSNKRVRDIARELGVTALVIVRVRRIGDRFHGGWELIGAKDESVIKSAEFDQAFGDLFAIEGALATAVAEALAGRVEGALRDQLAAPAAKSVEAYEFYLRGSEEMQTDTPEANAHALAYFERALELDSNLADAWVGVGAVRLNRVFFGWGGGAAELATAESAFERALDLAPSNREALRGLMASSVEQAKPVEQVLELGARVPIGPDASLDDLLARAQSYVTGGLPIKASSLLQRAAEIEPSNPAARWWLVIADNWAQEHQKAVKDAEVYFERFGEDAEVHFWTGHSYWNLGMMDEADIHFRRAIELFGSNPSSYLESSVAEFNVDLGRTDIARQLLEQAIARSEALLLTSPDNVRFRLTLADCYSLAADTTRFLDAARWLEQAIPREHAVVVTGFLRLGDLPEARRRVCNLTESFDVVSEFYVDFYRVRARAEATGDPRLRECLARLDQYRQRLSDRY